jgi:hypothetical protein
VALLTPFLLLLCSVSAVEVTHQVIEGADHEEPVEKDEDEHDHTQPDPEAVGLHRVMAFFILSLCRHTVDYLIFSFVFISFIIHNFHRLRVHFDILTILTLPWFKPFPEKSAASLNVKLRKGLNISKSVRWERNLRARIFRLSLRDVIAWGRLASGTIRVATRRIAPMCLRPVQKHLKQKKIRVNPSHPRSRRAAEQRVRE